MNIYTRIGKAVGHKIPTWLTVTIITIRIGKSSMSVFVRLFRIGFIKQNGLRGKEYIDL